MKTKKVTYSLAEFEADIYTLHDQVQQGHVKYEDVYGIPKGGIVPAIRLASLLNLPLTTVPKHRTLVVDDLIDTGRTRTCFPDNDIAVLHEKAWAQQAATYSVHKNCSDWIVYWWEGSEEKSIEDAVIRQLQFIGEDPTREGLQETPARVVRSWRELYVGYQQNVESVFKTFEDGACDEMVLLKNIEFYSTCEHHMLPFFGKAHIAYIPSGKVVGISKLARLLEVFARRLQIQERLGQQITTALMMHLKPLGAACILEAQHFCMTSRGVQKQNSIMVTSSLTGVFREKPEVRAEFMRLVR